MMVTRDRRARWSVLVLLAVASIVFAPVAQGSPKQSRVEEYPYDSPAAGIHGPVANLSFWNCNVNGSRIGCAQLHLGSADRTLAVEVNDATGQPVTFVVRSGDPAGVGSTVLYEGYGKTERPLRIRGVGSVFVTLHASAEPGQPSIPTHGLIQATITSR